MRKVKPTFDRCHSNVTTTIRCQKVQIYLLIDQLIDVTHFVRFVFRVAQICLLRFFLN